MIYRCMKSTQFLRTIFNQMSIFSFHKCYNMVVKDHIKWTAFKEELVYSQKDDSVFCLYCALFILRERQPFFGTFVNQPCLRRMK